MAENTFTLVVDMPGQDPVQHEITADLVNVGRGPDNDLQILISEVSVKHAQLKQEGDAVKILDLGSTNGTKVNGVRIDTAGRVLGAMDQLLLGETIKAYFVPTAMLATTPAAELITSLAAQAKPPEESTAPVAVAVKPAAVAAGPAAGAATVRLDQVKPSGPGPVVAPKPGGAPPVAPGPPRVAPGPPAATPPGSAPSAPRPVAPVPLQRPAPGTPPSPPRPPSPPKPGGA